MIVVRETIRYSTTGRLLVFETMAFLSTVGLVVTFAVLYHVDRKARREEKDQGAPRA